MNDDEKFEKEMEKRMKRQAKDFRSFFKKGKKYPDVTDREAILVLACIQDCLDQYGFDLRMLFLTKRPEGQSSGPGCEEVIFNGKVFVICD